MWYLQPSFLQPSFPPHIDPIFFVETMYELFFNQTLMSSSVPHGANI